jgi:hypothetical protein
LQYEGSTLERNVSNRIRKFVPTTSVQCDSIDQLADVRYRTLDSVQESTELITASIDSVPKQFKTSYLRKSTIVETM